MLQCFRRDGRKHYGTGSSRARHDHVLHEGSTTVIASFARAVEPGTWAQPQDDNQRAQARYGREFKDRANRAAFDGSDRAGKSGGLRLPEAHTAAAGRLPLFTPQPGSWFWVLVLKWRSCGSSATSANTRSSPTERSQACRSRTPGMSITQPPPAMRSLEHAVTPNAYLVESRVFG